jgi:hypothetical protein
MSLFTVVCWDDDKSIKRWTLAFRCRGWSDFLMEAFVSAFLVFLHQYVYLAGSFYFTQSIDSHECNRIVDGFYGL